VDLLIHPASAPLRGSVPVPADKSIAHRALLLAGLASGTSRLSFGAPLGTDNLATVRALRALGVAIEDGAEATVEGVGLHGLRAPAGELDCAGSATTMRLLAGVLVAQPFASRLVGDASLSRRPMERVARPLRLRGASIEGTHDPRRIGEITAPLEIGPLPAPHVLSGIEYDMPIASAQVKGALLLSGLYADEATYVREPLVSRDHTERMLQALGVPIEGVGAMVRLDAAAWSGVLPAFELAVPGDVSAAAFLVAAAILVPASQVIVRRASINPTRTGFFEILRDMDARLDVVPTGDTLGEPFGELSAVSSELQATRTGGEVLARAIDEVPALCTLAARAHGVSLIEGGAELRHKESDRIATMAAVLRGFGVGVEERQDGLRIEGSAGRPLRAADVVSHGDHRVAMAAAVLGLVADGPSRVRDADCIQSSFPRFVGTLRALGARVEVIHSEGARS
jgi:3-phosphoshikimate 1-carboxyvinyltransferase